MSIEDLNEPAFPIKGGYSEHQFGGMSLRDYFAAKEQSEPDSFFAEAFAVKATNYSGQGGRRPLNSSEMMQMRCAWRYAMADAMLLERTK